MSEPAPAPKSGLILAANAGSSSLKISLFERDGATPESPHDVVRHLLTSTISNIFSPPVRFTFALAGREAKNLNDSNSVDGIKDHASAFAHFLDCLKREASIDRSQIVHVCHRVVHGGNYFEPVVITEESYHHIEKLSDLAPL